MIDGPTNITTSLKSAARRIAAGFAAEVLRPIQGFRLTYLPLTMVYFAYGALGLIDVARDFWVKERLTLSAAELAGIGVWLNLPGPSRWCSASWSTAYRSSARSAAPTS